LISSRTIGQPSLHASRAGSSLLEVMFSLGLVAIGFGALFSIYSSAFPLLRNQQDNIAATLCLHERLDRVRFLSWPAITSSERLPQELFATPAGGGATLSGLVEEITISVYPSPSPLPAIKLRRRADGVVEVLSIASLSTASMVRVDLRDTWQQGRRTRTRELSAIVAYGGIVR
jgi:hypothetical protein